MYVCMFIYADGRRCHLVKWQKVRWTTTNRRNRFLLNAHCCAVWLLFVGRSREYKNDRRKKRGESTRPSFNSVVSQTDAAWPSWLITTSSMHVWIACATDRYIAFRCRSWYDRTHIHTHEHIGCIDVRKKGVNIAQIREMCVYIR